MDGREPRCKLRQRSVAPAAILSLAGAFAIHGGTGTSDILSLTPDRH